MSLGNINMNGLDGVQNDSLSDYLQYGEFVPLNLATNFKKGGQIQVVVCDVVSPAEFWVNIDDPSGTLKKMMIEMNEQYNKHDAGPFPSSMLPVRGLQFCTIKTDDVWYRAVVIGQPTSDGHVRIRRVDFGAVELVAITDLRPLRRQWASLPMQAFRSQLTRITPLRPGEEWSPEQTAAFSNMVCGGPLVATVTAVDTTLNTLHLYLVDPVTGRYANYELVKNFASQVDNSHVQPYVPPMPPPGLSRFMFPGTPDLPFKDLPVWRPDCEVFLELTKNDPQKALEFITSKIEDLLQIAYAVI